MAFTKSFQEVSGYPREAASEFGLGAVRRVKCAWGDRNTLYSEFFADANLVYPYVDSGGLCIARSAKMEPYGKQADAGSGAATYDHAIIEINYSQVHAAFSYSGSTYYIEEELRPRTMSFSDTQYALLWSDGTPLGEDVHPQRDWHTLEYRITIHNMTSVPAKALSLVGCVNSDSVVSYTLGRTFAIGTLVYLGAAARTNYRQFGTVRWSVSYPFVYMPWLANKLWRADKGQWEYAYLPTGTQYNRYTPAAFGNLL